MRAIRYTLGAGCVYSYRSGGSGCASQNVLVHAQNSVGWSSISVSAKKKIKKNKVNIYRNFNHLHFKEKRIVSDRLIEIIVYYLAVIKSTNTSSIIRNEIMIIFGMCHFTVHHQFSGWTWALKHSKQQ